MNAAKNWALRLIGWSLCLPAIALGPIAKFTTCDTTRPWVDGLFINTWRAYKKYNTKSWIRRMIGIYHNPKLTKQYWAILTTKKNVQPAGIVLTSVYDLNRLHDIQTTHEHHRSRVQEAKKGKVPSSQFGQIVVVGQDVHDGNHRIGALQEANFSEPVPVLQWRQV
jgi:hypothetical protein